MPNTSVIPLLGLTVTGITEFLAHHQVPSHESLAPQVEERTKGNPLFISQLLPLLRGRPLSTLPSALPEGVQAAVLNGIADLPEATRRLLAAASVLGAQFWIEGVSRLLEQDPDDSLRALQPAISEGLVGWEPDRPTAAFAHDLVREAIYSAIPAPERALLHHRAIELLSRSDGRGPRPTSPTLAQHYTAAAIASPQALDCHLEAALWAARDFDYEYAAVHLGHALECLEIVDPDNAAQRCEIIVRLGEAQVRAGDRGGGHRSLHEAIQLARRTGNDSQLAHAALAISPGLFSIEVGVVDYAQVSLLEESLARVDGARDDDLRIRLLARLALAVNGPGRHGQASTLLESAENLAARVPEGVATAEVIAARCAVDSGPDQFQARRSLIEDGLASALRHGQLETALLFRLFRVTARLEVADLAGAKIEIELFSDLGATLHLAPSKWYVILFRAMDALLQGDLASAEQAALQLAVEGSRVKDRNAQLSFAALMGLIRTEQGRLSEVLPAVESMKTMFPALDYAFDASLASAFAQTGQLEESRRAFDNAISRGLGGIPRDALFLEVASMLAVACAEIGTDQEASELYEMLVPFEDRVVVVGYSVACLGSLARFAAILATKLEQWDRAERHFLTALRCNQSLRSPLWAAHTYRGYARMVSLRRWPGDHARARDLQQKAHEIAISTGLDRLADVCSKEPDT